MKRVLAIAVAVALTAAVALLLVQRPGTPGATDVDAAAAPGHARIAATPAAPALHAADQADAYALDYAFALTADFGGGDETMTMRLQATLDLAPPRRDGGAAPAEATWLPARLRRPTLELDAVARRVLGLSGEESAAFAQSFAARLAADGRVEAVHLDPKATFTARSVLAAVAYAMQRARGPADAARWQAAEHDANGSYQARYERRDDGAIAKRWLVGQGDDPPSRLARITDSAVDYRFAGAVLSALDYREQGRAATGSLDPATYKPFSVRLTLRRLGAVDAAWAAAVRPEQLAAFSAADAPPGREAAIETRSYSAIVADAGVRAGSLDAAAHVTLRNEWTTLLARDAEALAATEADLRQGRLRGEQERLAVEAIVGARTPQAQDKVGAMIADDALPEALRLNLLTAVALMTRPTPALIQRLEQLAYAPKPGSLGAATATTLGASAGLLAEDDPKAAAAVVERLVANARPILHPPADVPKEPIGVRQAWLAGLGNTGDPQALPEILAALHDADEAIRGQAALSLRRFPAASCVDAMVEAMAKERSVHVRENLVDAARFMGPAAMQPFVEKALRFDASDHVRLAAAYAIAAWSTAAPGLRKVLASALEDASSPKVAEALQAYLSRGSLAGNPETAPVKLGHPAEAP